MSAIRIQVLFYFCSLICLLAQGQSLTISGKIIDANSKEPISFASVYVKNTAYGSISDSAGNYVLTLPKLYDTLSVFFTGYKEKNIAIPKKSNIIIDISLEPESNSLSEVVVFAKREPIEEIILRHILENKDKNNKENFTNYSHELYNKIEIDLKNLNHKIFDSKLAKPFQFIFDNVDSTTDESPFLPLFITESISDFYYQASPKKNREVIKASKISGVQNDYLTQYLGNMYADVNIYNNFVGIMLKEFVSPIANSCRFFYNYKVTDTIYRSDGVYYKMTFEPNTKADNTFFGDLLVDDQKFAIKEIRMSMAPHVNINFVKRIEIVQEFMGVNDSLNLLKSDKTIIEFAPLEKLPALIGRKTTSYEDIIVNGPPIDTIIDKYKDEITVVKGSFEKSDSFWLAERHLSLSKNESNIYGLIDSVKRTPAYKKYNAALYFLSSGYVKINKFDIGSLYSLLVLNPVEGLKFNIGGRTNYSFSKVFKLSGNIGYGLKSKIVTGSGELEWLFKKDPRQIIGISYIHDIKTQTSSTDVIPSDNILTRLFRRKVDLKLLLLDQARISYEREWKPGISSKITFQNRRVEPLTLPFNYLRFNTEKSTYDTLKKLNQSEFVLNLRFAPKEKFMSNTIYRTSLGTSLPVVEVEYALGLKNLFKSQFTYHKISGIISDDFPISPIGFMKYKLWGGKVFGNVPFLLSNIPDGNETYFYNNGRMTFNLMNDYEFYSDAWIGLSLVHHFDGFFFNRIPGFRKLKWREVIETKMLWGKTGKKALEQNIGSTIVALNGKPYIEVGFGIENIFKFFKIDFLWRATYRENPNVPKFGALLGMEFRL